MKSFNYNGVSTSFWPRSLCQIAKLYFQTPPAKQRLFRHAFPVRTPTDLHTVKKKKKKRDRRRDGNLATLALVQNCLSSNAV